MCPGCSTGFEVPDDKLQPDLILRCHRCGHEWLAPYPPDASNDSTIENLASADAIGAELDGSQSNPTLTAPVRIKAPAIAARSRALLAAWVLSVFLVGGAGWMAVAHRRGVVAVWPPMERLYQAIGLGSLPQSEQNAKP
jgi:predicted Zn finger-like uncharacterized protein